MDKVHKQNIKMMEACLDNCPDLYFKRALDVGAGDGRVTKDLLHRLFEAVDIFEPAADGFAKIMSVKALLPKLKHTHLASMLDYEFKEEYSLIMLVWCSGYVDDM